MKKLTLILTFIAFFTFCYSQETIELNFDLNQKVFKEKTESKKFKDGKIYQIKIKGLNTAIINYKIKSKSFTLTSTIPDIIKPIFPGITNNVFLAQDRYKPDQNELYSESMKRYKNLCHLKIKSDTLYSRTKTKSDTAKARLTLNEIQNIFGAKSIDELKQKVSLSSKFIIIVNELFKKKIEENPDVKTIDKYDSLWCIADGINSENYLSYVNFIEKSLIAKDYIEYKPFKAGKDIVDLNLTFINNYTKDTVYNSSISFYTSGKFSFDFSTGFFCNNLIEKSYYTDKRDSLKNNVLLENNFLFDVSFGALGHFSYKISNCFKAGVNMGAAFSPLDGKTRYLLGGSLLFGRKNQLGINGGLVLGKMKILSKSVKNDETGKYVGPLITSVPTYDKIQSGFFIGLTYNLTSTKK